MPKFVICTIPLAPLLIGGIAFEPSVDGIVSVEPVEDEEADRLGTIPGYALADEKPVVKELPPPVVSSSVPASAPAPAKRGRPPNNPAPATGEDSAPAAAADGEAGEGGEDGDAGEEGATEEAAAQGEGGGETSQP